MVPTKHPDATAFAARFLAQPEDRLGRLVFADWLDEQGGESNMAWAQYLRLRARCEVDSDSIDPVEAATVGRRVRARLTLLRVPGRRLLTRLSGFIPAERVWMRIGSHRTPPAALNVVPHSLARLYRLMPIHLEELHLFAVFASEDTQQFEPLRRDLENFLCCRLTAFRGDAEDVSRVIDAHYGRHRRVVWDGLIVRESGLDTR